MRRHIRTSEREARGYYGCLGAAKGACENKMLVHRKLAEKGILGAMAEQIRHVLARVEAEVARL
ncbi:MAG: hypothetical protein OXT72_04845 [Gammaproteobacteria bacterium]|nr:hypothetical protein [Gammaproteobacteria bacterium]MDE0247680.1 hypothetical protein [Gammaproteobacteria bacterium]